MSVPRRVLLVANPRSGRAQQGLDAALRAFRADGIDVERATPGSAAEMSELIHARGAGFDAIVVAGGDGTVNAAANAVADIDVPLAILPFGTANDLAHTIGVPMDPGAAAGLVGTGFTRRIDLGRVNDQVFLNAASLGLPVIVTEQQDPVLKRRLKSLSYVVATVKAVRTTRRFTVWITVDGAREEHKAIQVTVGNGVRFGGGMRVGRDGAIDDGILDVFSIEADRLIDLVRIAPAIRFGFQEEDPNIHTYRGRDIRVETKREMQISTDGEITTTTPATFSVQRAALEVFVPQAMTAGLAAAGR